MRVFEVSPGKVFYWSIGRNIPILEIEVTNIHYIFGKAILKNVSIYCKWEKMSRVTFYSFYCFQEAKKKETFAFIVVVYKDT